MRPSLRDQGYIATTWGRREGVPPGLDRILTTPDGLLWVVAAPALYRFDGARMTRVLDAEGAPLDVLRVQGTDVAGDGALWITSRDGVILRIDAQDQRRYDADDGLPAGTVIQNVARARDGGPALAATAAGLYALREDRWHPVGPAELAGRKIYAVEIDAHAAWLIVEGELWRMDPGLGTAHRVRTLDDAVLAGLVSDASGQAWLWQRAGDDNLCRLDADIACERADAMVLPHFDAEGVAWWTSGQHLLSLKPRRAASDATSGTRQLDTGVSLSGRVAVMADGSHWLEASGKMLHVRPTPVMRVPAMSGAVVRATEGDVWVAGFTNSLRRIGRAPGNAPLVVDREGHASLASVARDGDMPASVAIADLLRSRPVVLERFDDLPQTVVRLDRTPDGRTWLATLAPPSLWSFDGKTWAPHALPALSKGAVIRTVAQDVEGRVLLALLRDAEGLYRFEHDAWAPIAWRPPAGPAELRAMALDREGTIWISHGGTTVMAIRDGERVAHGAGSGLDIGVTGLLVAIDGDIWVAGERGVARRRDGRFDTLRFDALRPLTSISGLEVDDDGALWIASAQGLARITRDDLDEAFARPAGATVYTMLDDREGIDHAIVDTAPSPALHKAADGALWLYTNHALYRILPREVPAGVAAPPLRVAAWQADGERLAGAQAPPGSTRLVAAIDVLGPAVADRTRLRYRVPALDEDWHPLAGRDLVLERVPPGTYALELQASDERGAWTGAVTSSTITLAPLFRETTWAKLLFALAIATVVAVLVATRIRRVAARERGLADARLRERERIAREIHDTLLQGVSGLLMTMQGVARRIGPDHAASGKLDANIAIAERVLADGRDRVAALRSSDDGAPSLEHALEMHARDLASEHAVACSVHVDGTPRTLHVRVRDELLQIGREALTNAFRHAEATRIVVRLDYGDEVLVLQVADDGCGMRDDAADERTRWGVKGMHERASLAGARLSIDGIDGGGVRVTVVTPARRAYRDADAGRTRGWRRFGGSFAASRTDD
ncbi:histidine kinase [Dokdonella sp. MW10]|uniref:histidine kinase n=1 Tax=Dokdonella sp. MW10 TaxID=2992926 RepID=UPI003F7EE92B